MWLRYAPFCDCIMYMCQAKNSLHLHCYAVQEEHHAVPMNLFHKYDTKSEIFRLRKYHIPR